jgi:hypothetical protein
MSNTVTKDYWSGVVKMFAAMLLMGTVGYFVIESKQQAHNVVFFRCLFGVVFLSAYSGYFQKHRANKEEFRANFFKRCIFSVQLDYAIRIFQNGFHFYLYDYISYSTVSVCHYMVSYISRICSKGKMDLNVSSFCRCRICDRY